MSLLVSSLIFDLDGTLIDSEPLWHWAWSHVVSLKNDSLADDVFNRLLGMVPEQWSTFLHEHYQLALTPAEIRASVEGALLDRFRENVPKMKGADGVLRRLAGPYVLALATATGRELVETILETAGWTQHFAVVVCGDDVTEGKPAPALYQRTIALLSTPIERIIAIEDSAVGLLAAKKAGIQTIEIPDPEFPPPLERIRSADSILSDLRMLSMDVVERTAAARTSTGATRDG